MPTPPSDLGTTAPAPTVLDEQRTIWLTTLYEANVRMVSKTCRRLLRNHEDAADATQEVFLRAAASLHAAPDSKDAAAWLTTVARNHCLDVLRRQQKFQSALTTLGADVTELESQTRVVDRHLAETVLLQLAVRERQALWESHVEERPVKEIAQRLGISYLAAAQLLHRARRRAALVAAELAALLLLLRTAVRRGRTAIQQTNFHPLAAVVTVPLVATALIATSSGRVSNHAPMSRAPAAPHRVVAQVAPTAQPPQAGPTTTNPSVALNPSSTLTATGSSITQSTVATVKPPVLPSPTAAPPTPAPSGPPHKKKHHIPPDRDPAHAHDHK